MTRKIKTGILAIGMLVAGQSFAQAPPAPQDPDQVKLEQAWNSMLGIQTILNSTMPALQEALQREVQNGNSQAQSASIQLGQVTGQRDWWIACAQNPACLSWVWPGAPNPK